MSTVNYSLKNKGVRLISADKAWTTGKNGKRRLNPKYRFIGKIQTSMPNFVVTADDRKKPQYRGNTYDLNVTAKNSLLNIFTMRTVNETSELWHISASKNKQKIKSKKITR